MASEQVFFVVIIIIVFNDALKEEMGALRALHDTESKRYCAGERRLSMQLAAIKKEREEMRCRHKMETADISGAYGNKLKKEEHRFEILQTERNEIETANSESMARTKVLQQRVLHFQSLYQQIGAGLDRVIAVSSKIGRYDGDEHRDIQLFDVNMNERIDIDVFPKRGRIEALKKELKHCRDEMETKQNLHRSEIKRVCAEKADLMKKLEDLEDTKKEALVSPKMFDFEIVPLGFFGNIEKAVPLWMR